MAISHEKILAIYRFLSFSKIKEFQAAKIYLIVRLQYLMQCDQIYYYRICLILSAHYTPEVRNISGIPITKNLVILFQCPEVRKRLSASFALFFLAKPSPFLWLERSYVMRVISSAHHITIILHTL